MKSAVVIVNLGTPVAPTKRAVAAFLKEFLSDRRVVEVPRLIWFFILNLIIIPFRTPKVVEAYRSIWGETDSPLRSITERQAAALANALRETLGEQAPIVRYAMTYSGPSIERVIDELAVEGVEHVLVLPLYPQFSATTTGSVYDRVSAIFKRRNFAQIHIVKQYFDHPLYIEALAQSVRDRWDERGGVGKLLISFHSIPERYCELGDPYYQQCKVTAQLLAEKLQLNREQWTLCFQSRLGKAKWLSPYTIDVVRELGRNNEASISIICPAFAADCLETLEEIAVENARVFAQSGGGQFDVVPCLNESAAHIRLLEALTLQYLPSQSGERFSK